MTLKKSPIQSALDTDGVVKEGYSLYGKIYSEDPKDPKNPEVMVSGMYRMPFGLLKRSITDMLKDVIKNVDSENFGAALSLLDGLLYQDTKSPGIISHQIRALKDVQTEMGSKTKKK